MDSRARLDSAGLFIVPWFLDSDVCRTLRDEASRAPHVMATITRHDDPEALVESTRSTRRAQISAPARAPLESRLAALLPDLGQHFNEPLTGFQQPQLLVYRRRDFFRVHQDNSDDERLPEHVRARRVSVVIFLNSQAALPAPGAYCGGSLTFFRLPGASDIGDVRADLQGEEGLLVAFPSSVMHEVRPVTHGVRYTAVSWFTVTGEVEPDDVGP
jgi:SM-20-related protein